MADSPDIRALLADLILKHDQWVDSRSQGFRSRMEEIAALAALDVVRQIREKAKKEGISTGEAVMTRIAAQRLMRQADRLYLEALEKRGWLMQVEALTSQLAVPGSKNRQSILFRDTFEAIRSTLKNPIKGPQWGAADIRFFEDRRKTVAKALNTQIESIAKSTVSRALLNSGSLSFNEFTSVLVSSTGKTWTSLEGLSATALTTHYRTLHNQSFTLVEEQNQVELQMVYAGPRDKLTRPFCRKVLDHNEPRTREEINALDPFPSLLKPVITACGGYNCRHMWIMASVK